MECGLRDIGDLWRMAVSRTSHPKPPSLPIGDNVMKRVSSKQFASILSANEMQTTCMQSSPTSMQFVMQFGDHFSGAGTQVITTDMAEVWPWDKRDIQELCMHTQSGGAIKESLRHLHQRVPFQIHYFTL